MAKKKVKLNPVHSVIRSENPQPQKKDFVRDLVVDPAKQTYVTVIGGKSFFGRSRRIYGCQLQKMSLIITPKSLDSD